MRSDAEQNRARILEAARTALAESADASLNSIAKLAGVGPGTLYRHFPNREALMLAVYREDVRQLVEAAPALLDGASAGRGAAPVARPPRPLRPDQARPGPDPGRRHERGPGR